MNYDVVIGLEIHAELKTESKVFCACKNEFGGNPNTHCCPVCIGLPGALPVLNQQAVVSTIKAGLCFDCEINKTAVFERKNYFYPDLAKAYQISQLENPICLGGGVKLDSGKLIRFNRIHLEEDAGKLIHSSHGTVVDYNRAGVPLIEMVSEPDMSSAEEALEFMNKVRDSIVYAGIAECKMEQGGMRADVNVSLKPKGDKKLGTRTEMKNINSFKMIGRAIEYEIKRQIEILDKDGKITQETRRWNDARGKNESMRSKEDSADYRYFPDPDILTVEISRGDVKKIADTMPLLPSKLKAKFVGEYGLTEYDADVLLADKPSCDYFASSVRLVKNNEVSPKTLANYLVTVFMSKKVAGEAIVISDRLFVDIAVLAETKKISRTNAVALFRELFDNAELRKETAHDLAKRFGMLNDLSDDGLYAIIDTVLANNPQAAKDYKATPDKILNFLTGQVMKETKGKADTLKVKEYLKRKFEA